MPGLDTYLAAGVVAAFVISGIGIFWKVYRSGRASERAKQQEKVNAAVRERAKADTLVGGATDDELDDFLRPPDRRG